jgi:hypothetical protein
MFQGDDFRDQAEMLMEGDVNINDPRSNLRVTL